jgi:glycosyltransferase involved in cell wall biosynthesis
MTNNIKVSQIANKKVIIIIPALNEGMNIEKVVSEAQDILPQALVTVIDDGSSDDTGIIARRTGADVLTLPFNIGIGGAVQTGMKFAKRNGFDFIIRIDGDGQHYPNDIPILLKAVMDGETDVAVGSRFCDGRKSSEISLPRRIGIFLFSTLTSILSGQKVTDPTSGFIVMNKKAIGFLSKNLEQDYPEVDARVFLLQAGFQVREYPVEMRIRQGGESSINAWRALYYALKVTFSILIAKTRKYS